MRTGNEMKHTGLFTVDWLGITIRTLKPLRLYCASMMTELRETWRSCQNG